MPASPLWRSPWLLRLLWLVVPVLAGPALDDALSSRDRPVQVVASVLAWSLWSTALAASLVPRSTSLTVVRTIVPAGVPVAVWAALATDRPGWGAAGVAATAIASLSLAWPGISDAFVDGSSYGSERRVALRVPPALLIGPVPLAWLAVVGGAITGPLLLAAGTVVPGVAALLAGSALVVLGVPRLHLLSRRWLVFVPAGVVVHDPLTLTEPILLQRHLLRRVAPAPADSTALDCTAGALGVTAAEPFAVGVRSGRRGVEHTDVSAVLVTPTQPAETLAIAEGHRLPVG
jgi:hypothetical protein